MFSIALTATLMMGLSWVVPVGPEFQVNTYSMADQCPHSIAVNVLGNFVVTWTDENGKKLLGKRYNALGIAQSGEFQANVVTGCGGTLSSVAMDASGNFVVVWADCKEVFGRRYDATGEALDNEFIIATNCFSWDYFWNPSVAMDSLGNFVVVWEGLSSADRGVYGRRYDASGTAQGSEFKINNRVGLILWYPSVAMDVSGNFVVVWLDNRLNPRDTNYDVFGRRYDASGTAQGDAFLVNTNTVYQQHYPSVAMDASGRFVVVWDEHHVGSLSDDVYGQCYDADGVTEGHVFQVNTYATNKRFSCSRAAMDAAGNFIVTWESVRDGIKVCGQRYSNPPVVFAIDANSSLTEGNTRLFNVTFSEAVTGVDVTDFALFITGDVPDAVILSVTGLGKDYTVLVGDVAGDGTLRLDLIDDDTIIDGDGIPLGGVGVGNGNFTTGGVYQVVLQLPSEGEGEPVEGEGEPPVEGEGELPVEGEPIEGEGELPVEGEGEPVEGEGETAEGEPAEGESEGETVEGESPEGEHVEGELTEGEVIEGEGELIEGEPVEGEVTEGEHVEGNPEGEIAEGEMPGDEGETDPLEEIAKDLEDNFDILDSNSDDRLSIGELLTRFPEFDADDFAALDLNGDGFLSLVELQGSSNEEECKCGCGSFCCTPVETVKRRLGDWLLIGLSLLALIALARNRNV